MANQLFPTGRRRWLRGEIAWTSGGDDFVLVLLDASYTFSDAHEFADDLTGVLGDPATLTGVADLEDGVADADDVSVTGVDLGDTATQLAIYKDTGSPATSPLLYFADDNDDTTPIGRVGDGGAISIVWSNGPDRLFRI